MYLFQKTNAAKLVEQAEIIEKLSKEKQAVKKVSKIAKKNFKT